MASSRWPPISVYRAKGAYGFDVWRTGSVTLKWSGSVVPLPAGAARKRRCGKSLLTGLRENLPRSYRFLRAPLGNGVTLLLRRGGCWRWSPCGLAYARFRLSGGLDRLLKPGTWVGARFSEYR